MTGTHDTEPLAVWWESMSPEERALWHSYSASSTTASAIAFSSECYNAGSNLVLVPIQDVFGWRDRINHPATISDANWTYTLPWPVDRLMLEPDAIERANRLAAWSRDAGRWNAPENDD